MKPSKSKSDLNRDLTGGLIALGIAIAYYVGASHIPRSGLIGQGIGADALPRGLAMVLAVLGLLLLAQTGWKLLNRAFTEGKPLTAAEKRAEIMSHLRAGGMLGIGIVYLALFTTIGWSAAIFLLLLAVAWYNGAKPGVRLVGFAAVVTVALYLLFDQVLNINMPTGIWPELFGLDR